MKLENENDLKNISIKQYEEMFRLIKTQKNITYDDILIKMREEIIRLNNQIASLNKTRDSIENFYKQEILKMMDLVKISKNKTKSKSLNFNINNNLLQKNMETIYNTDKRDMLNRKKDEIMKLLNPIDSKFKKIKKKQTKKRH